MAEYLFGAVCYFLFVRTVSLGTLVIFLFLLFQKSFIIKFMFIFLKVK
ncbi:unnamed protein product [Arabidopsis halleri]